MGGAGAELVDGLEEIPVLGLLEAVALVKGKDAPTQETLRKACEKAFKKADELLAEGPDPHGLSRDDIAAIHLYTQSVARLLLPWLGAFLSTLQQ